MHVILLALLFMYAVSELFMSPTRSAVLNGITIFLFLKRFSGIVATFFPSLTLSFSRHTFPLI